MSLCHIFDEWSIHLCDTQTIITFIYNAQPKFTNGDSQQQCIFCHRSKPMSWWLLHTEHSMPESSQFLPPSPVCRVKPKAAGFTIIGARMEPNTRLILVKPTAEGFNEHKDLLQ